MFHKDDFQLKYGRYTKISCVFKVTAIHINQKKDSTFKVTTYLSKLGKKSAHYCASAVSFASPTHFSKLTRRASQG